MNNDLSGKTNDILRGILVLGFISTVGILLILAAARITNTKNPLSFIEPILILINISVDDFELIVLALLILITGVAGFRYYLDQQNNGNL